MLPHFLGPVGMVDRSSLMDFWLLMVLCFLGEGPWRQFNRTIYSERARKEVLLLFIRLGWFVK